MKKTATAVAVFLALSAAGVGAQAALLNGVTTLQYANGNVGGYGSAAAAGASWFSMQVGPTSFIYTGLQNGLDGGIKVGATQGLPAGVFSHTGLPYGGTSTSDTGAIDTGWGFFGNTGLHFTASPTNIVSGGGNSGSTLDFSGLRWTWDGTTANVGGGLQIVTGSKGSTTYNNGSGLATITCSTVSCSNSSTFTLDYSAIIPAGDPSSLGGIAYGMHLTGQVSTVPVPAAAWLFGSGLAGLMSAARRRTREVPAVRLGQRKSIGLQS